MHVVFVTPECAPCVKTGGLGEVLAALPAAIATEGHEVTLYLPYYRKVRETMEQQPDATVPPPVLLSVTIPFSDSNRFVRVLDGGSAQGVQTYLVDCPEFFDRDGIYGPPGENYPDNALRFGLYCRAVLEASKLLGVPDVFHAHDWQAAMVPVLLRTTYAADPLLRSAATVFSIHNGAYQGEFPEEVLQELLLPASLFRESRLASAGKVNLFKGGLVFSDAITTVSPHYAEELQTPEYGEGMDAILRDRREVLTGILNGVDYDVWDPAKDPRLAAHYSPENLEGKRECRRNLLHAFHADGVSEETAIVGMVSRIAVQKGFDLVTEAFNQLAAEDVLLVVLGSGEPELQKQFQSLAERYPERLRVNFEFDDTLAHKIEAGADMTLMPSRYEPSGLTQMYSLRYGTVPIVRGTGGLDDTVQEGSEGNGFRFEAYESGELVAAVRRALTAFQDKAAWQAIMRRGMRQDFPWERPAREYISVYERAIKAHRGK